ncbi:PREDICTED: uncharacterized protein LOC109217992 [Nicotiana attenuata]|uniref:uncharacterized protein LOC109217992 n=1 Tax=Nicotiana attenuata TaxID=49451 RepID=UPI000905B2F8|nr:PREDICTED: uncharacterized protein LOC109217992 [Nicotiana attenuata]
MTSEPDLAQSASNAKQALRSPPLPGRPKEGPMGISNLHVPKSSLDPGCSHGIRAWILIDLVTLNRVMVPSFNFEKIQNRLFSLSRKIFSSNFLQSPAYIFNISVDLRFSFGFESETVVVEARVQPSNPGFSGDSRDYQGRALFGCKRGCSLSPEIAESVQYSETAKSIWEQLNKKYGAVNGTKIFEIKKELASTMQGALDIAFYFNKLKKLWDELRVMRSNKINACACPIRAELLKKEEEDRVHQFLMDEKQRQVNPGSNFSSKSASFNVSGFNNKAPFAQPQRQYTQRINFDQSKGNLSNLFCKYCKKPGHLVDKGYKLHGFPPNFKFTKGKRIAVNVTTESEFSNDSNPNSSGFTPNVNSGIMVSSEGQMSSIHGLTQQQYTQLMNLLQQSQLSESVTSPHIMASANFAGILLSDSVVSGSSSCMLTQTTNPRKLIWIINSGATDLMTSNKDVPFNITPLTIPYLVSLPNRYKIKAHFLKKPLELGRVDDGLYKAEDVVFHELVFPFDTSSTSSSHAIQSPSLPPSPALDPFSDTIVPVPVPTNELPSTSLSTLASPPPPNPASPTISADTIPSILESPTPPLRRSDRPHHLPSYLQDYKCQLHVSFSCSSVQPVEFEPYTYTHVAPIPSWQDAMRKEFEALEANNTWDIVELPAGTKPIGSVAVKHGWSMLQLDVNNAFLHGDLHEEVYMKLPQGLSISSSSSSAPLVCKLKKSLYGLKQPSRQWYAKLSQALCSRGYTHSLNDYSLFVKGSSGDIVILAHYFLGIEVSTSPAGVFLNQRKFVLDLLKKYNCLEVSSVVSPLDLNSKLKADSGELFAHPERYRSLIGKPLFLTHTRPDLCFGVQHLSQFLQAPRLPHMTAALHMLRYLKGTIIVLSQLILIVIGQLALILAKTTCFSSAEAEYRALSKVVAELTWLTRLLPRLSVHVSYPVSVYCDNQAAIHIARNPVFHERTKHIEVDCHFIIKKLADGLIQLFHVSTSNQLADIFTKSLPGVLHQSFLSKLKVFSPSNLKEVLGYLTI